MPISENVAPEPIDLSGLRDIHMPVPPDWWPPAIGWWLVLIGVMVVLILGGLGYLYWYTRPRQYALRTWAATYKTTRDPVVLARALSALLKRLALMIYPREQVAALAAEAWEAFLQQTVGDTLSDSQRHLIAFAVFMPPGALPAESASDLYVAGRRAIGQLMRGSHHGH